MSCLDNLTPHMPKLLTAGSKRHPNVLLPLHATKSRPGLIRWKFFLDPAGNTLPLVPARHSFDAGAPDSTRGHIEAFISG